MQEGVEGTGAGGEEIVVGLVRVLGTHVGEGAFGALEGQVPVVFEVAEGGIVGAGVGGIEVGGGGRIGEVGDGRRLQFAGAAGGTLLAIDGGGIGSMSEGGDAGVADGDGARGMGLVVKRVGGGSLVRGYR